MGIDPTPFIRKTLDRYAEEHVGIVAGIISPDVTNGKTLMFGGGDTLWNSQHQPMTLDGDTPFEIGSITKIFTSLVQYSARQNYDGTLGEFITAVTLPSGLSDLPILDLANYSPGFPTDNKGGWWPAGTVQNLPNLLNYLATPRNLPQNPAGTCYSYSNFGWSLLAMAALGISSESDNVLELWAEAIATISWPTFVNLKNTAPYDESMRPSLPVGHRSNGDIFDLDANYQPTAPMLFGAGDLVSTGNDMLQWLAFHMGQVNLEANLSALVSQQQTTWNLPQCPPNPKQPSPTVSRGWFHHQVRDGNATFLAKDGGVGGFTSWMGFQSWVETGVASPIGCFVLTNSHVASQLGMLFINALLGQEDEKAFYVTPAGV